MNEENKSRVAELMSELLGAKMAVEIVKEAWGAASPDAKQAIADALLADIRRRIEKDDWSLRGVLEKQLHSLVHEEMVAHDGAIRTIVKEHVAQWSETAIKAAVLKAAEAATRYAVPRIVREIHEHFEKSGVFRGL